MLRAWIVAVLTVAALCAGTAKAADWTTEQRIVLGAALAAHAVDWGQTRHIAKSNGQYVEVDPITSRAIGSQPSTGQVDAWMLGTAAAFYLAADAFPRYRTDILAFWLATRMQVVVSNHQLGLRVNLGF